MKMLVYCFVFLACLQNVGAQAGYSTGSHHRTKQQSARLIVPKPSEIVMEEFFNYHRHDLPLPTQNENVKMDMRWGNGCVSERQEEAILQVGFTTPRSSEFIDYTPLNIAIVIDRSGSMSGDRIEHARQSALMLVERLRPQDVVSLVTFDDRVETVLEGESAKNKYIIQQAIKNIDTRGSTDLNAGLIRGYEIATRQYKKNGNNKVLLLTDVLTNTGEVNVEQIVKNASNYVHTHLINITLVAIGAQVNEALGRQITKSGRHSYHYVNDSEDIKKIFVDEVESIFTTIAKDVKISIKYDENLTLEAFYGYSPTFHNNTIELPLNNMNAGLTQVVLAKFKARNVRKAGKVTATISYYDVAKGKTVRQEQVVSLDYDRHKAGELLKDNEVKKCISIAEMVSALQDMAASLTKSSLAKKDYQSALHLLAIAMNQVQKRYSYEMDKDVKRVWDMLANYTSQIQTVAKDY